VTTRAVPTAVSPASLRLAARGASVIAIAIGSVVLLGWTFDITSIKSVLPVRANMKANTALAVVLSGTALWTLTAEWVDRRRRWVARLCAAGAAMIGLVTLAEYLLRLDLGTSQLLFNDLRAVTETRSAGRTAPITAAGLVALAAALLNLERRPGRWLPQGVALGCGVASVAALVGYVCEMPPLYTIGPYTGMALPTAVSLIFLCVGILCARPDGELMTIVTSDTIGGVMTRRLLPAAIGVPVLLGWLRLQGERAGFYGTEFGIALVAVSSIVFLGFVILWNGQSLMRSDVERKQALAELTESQTMFRRLFESAPDAVFLIDSNGRVVFSNSQAETMFGYDRDAFPEMSVEALMPERFRERHVGHRAGYGKEPRPMGATRDLTCRRKDGSEFPADISLSPVRVGDGAMIIATVRDVTERTRAAEEIRALNTELERRVLERTAELAAANKELEAFAYTVAHDLRGPARHMHGFAELVLRREQGLEEASTRYLRAISDSAGKMGQLIDDLLAFARTGRAELHREPVELTELVREVRKELTPVTRRRQISWSVGPLPAVEGDPTLLRLVVSNLLSNAVKFSAVRSEARIEIGATTNGDDEEVIFVRDNGVGFDMRYAHKLFGVFRRLHQQEEFEGTGIGLATVQRVIQRHGGRVWAKGEVDRGATFYFSLRPASPAVLGTYLAAEEARSGGKGR